MKFKLDENFGRRTLNIFRQSGFEIETVYDEGLQGKPDRLIYETCCKEKRCLITLDLDFSNIVRFPPEKSAGIVVLRLPHNPTLPELEKMILQFLRQISKTPIENELWIVESNRIRIHQ
jgi:predicted nuclease of predicted toxin-antitoxin system